MIRRRAALRIGNFKAFADTQAIGFVQALLARLP
jgi:hypothetical protein